MSNGNENQITTTLDNKQGGVVKPHVSNTYNSHFPSRIQSTGYEYVNPNDQQPSKLDKFSNSISTNTSSTTNTTTTTTDKKPTLNINAGVYVPKEKKIVVPKKEEESVDNKISLGSSVTSTVFTPTTNVSSTYLGNLNNKIGVNNNSFIPLNSSPYPFTQTNGYNYTKPNYNTSITTNVTNPVVNTYIPLNNTVQTPVIIPTNTPTSDVGVSNPKLNLNVNTKPYVPKNLLTNKENTTNTNTGNSSVTGSNTPTIKEGSNSFNFESKKDESQRTSFTKEVKNHQENEHINEKHPEVHQSNNQNNKIETTEQQPQPEKKEVQTQVENQIPAPKKVSKLNNLFEKDPVPVKVVVKDTTQSKPTPLKDDKSKFVESRKKVDELKKKEKQERDEIDKHVQQMKKEEEEKKRQENEERKRREAEEKEKESKISNSHSISTSNNNPTGVQETNKDTTKIERIYFIVRNNEPKQANVMSVEYMMSFEKLRICNEKTLLSDDFKDHLVLLQTKEEDRPAQKNTYATTKKDFKKLSTVTKPEQKTIKEDNVFRRPNKIELSNTTTVDPTSAKGGDLKKWGRMDLTKHIMEAEELREKMNQARSEDTLKDEMVDWLNKITVDTYQDVKVGLFNLVKSDVDYQIKLLEVLFKKALTEKSYVHLYAKLCKDFDKELPQKTEISKDSKTISSKFRKALLDKSKDIFGQKNLNENKSKDPDIRLGQIKKEVLGNVIFITELISTKVLSKSVAFQCLAALFKRLDRDDEDSNEDKEVNKQITLLNIEGIVILLDKFGTFINKQDKSIKPDALLETNQKISDNIDKINDYVTKNSSTLPGHIQFKVINLIEKKKRGWELTEVDKIQKAKGIKEANEELSKQDTTMQVDSEDITKQIKIELNIWKDLLDSNGDVKKMDWRISENLICKKDVGLYEILNSLSDLSVDFINNRNVCHQVSHYFYELLKYYTPFENSDKKYKLKEILINSFTNLSDIMLDNMLLCQFWGEIYFSLTIPEYKICYFTEIDNCQVDSESQVKPIFEAIYYASQSCLDTVGIANMLNEVSTTNLAKNYPELFAKYCSDYEKKN